MSTTVVENLSQHRVLVEHKSKAPSSEWRFLVVCTVVSFEALCLRWCGKEHTSSPSRSMSCVSDMYPVHGNFHFDYTTKSINSARLLDPTSRAFQSPENFKFKEVKRARVRVRGLIWIIVVAVDYRLLLRLTHRLIFLSVDSSSTISPAMQFYQ